MGPVGLIDMVASRTFRRRVPRTRCDRPDSPELCRALHKARQLPKRPAAQNRPLPAPGAFGAGNDRLRDPVADMPGLAPGLPQSPHGRRRVLCLQPPAQAPLPIPHAPGHLAAVAAGGNLRTDTRALPGASVGDFVNAASRKLPGFPSPFPDPGAGGVGLWQSLFRRGKLRQAGQRLTPAARFMALFCNFLCFAVRLKWTA